jgi:diguanylate cyclase (GGDEF)-like protein
MTATQVLNIFGLYAYSFAILCIIAYKTYRNEDRASSQSRLFRILLGLNAALLIVDGLSTGLDGFGGAASRVVLEHISIANLSLQTLVAYVWLLFVLEVSATKNQHRALSTIILAIPLFSVIAMLLVTPLTGLGFAYDGKNRYTRTLGSYYIIATDFAYILLAYAKTLKYRDRIGRKKTLALLSFALPPALSGLFQIFMPTISLVWPALTISLLINYLAIQNEQLFLDHLTGVNNRRSLDIALKRKINGNQRSEVFGLLLIDLDDFKSINDTYGHLEGDHALEATAQILRRCFHHYDFISRYGGDEFLVIVELREEKDLAAIERRLEEQLARWNDSSGNPWKLAFSIGGVAYAPSAVLSPDDCLRQIDGLLYERKRAKKGS